MSSHTFARCLALTAVIGLVAVTAAPAKPPGTRPDNGRTAALPFVWDDNVN
jgi:hypothetical protein